MSCFAPCPACKRHVATDETACPFCSTALPDSFRDAVMCRTPRGRLNRAAMMVAGAALMGAEACSSSNTSVMALYGAPFPDAGTDTSGDGNTDDGSANESGVPIYGAPAPAASEVAAPAQDANPPGTRKT